MMKMLEELREKAWQLSYENQQLRRYKDINSLMRDAIAVMINERNPQTLFRHLFAITSQVMGEHQQVIFQRLNAHSSKAKLLSSALSEDTYTPADTFTIDHLFDKAYNFFNVKISSQWPETLNDFFSNVTSVISHPMSTPTGEYLLIIASPNLGQFSNDNATTLKHYAGFISGVLTLIETQRLATERDALLVQQARIQQSLERQEKLASIGQLAAGVAHELNNPLGFIQSNLVTLQSYVEHISQFIKDASSHSETAALAKKYDLEFIKEDMLDLMNDCLSGASKATGIVQNLRSYSHPNTDNAEITNIEEVVNSTLTIAATNIKHKASMVVDIIDHHCRVLINKNHLSQIILNLVTNAAQAIKHDQGEINIRVQKVEKYCVILVEDNGMGINETSLPYIFDPFYTTKQVGEGTGLGLSLSRNLAEQAKGTLTLDATGPKGSRFALTLPIVEVSATLASTQGGPPLS